MIKDRDIISLSFLLDLKNVNILRELVDFLSCDSIDESGLTNTVSTNQTIFTALNQLQLRLIQQCFTTDNQSQVVDQNVGLERIDLIMNNLRWWDSLLMLKELFNLLIKGILGSFLLLVSLLSEWVLLLGVIVTL